MKIRLDSAWAYEDDDAYYSNDAHGIAFQGRVFQFDQEMELIPDFELHLMRAARDVWHSRTVETKRGGRKFILETTLTDLLTGERFTI